MESDRELLELAAKAAGINIIRSRLDDAMHRDMLVSNSARNPHHETGPWNPLKDDGDALRLAVILDLAVTPYPIYKSPKHSVLAQLKNLEDSRFEVMELHSGDKYAATRRAIVRAAAEIGRQ